MDHTTRGGWTWHPVLGFQPTSSPASGLLLHGLMVGDAGKAWHRPHSGHTEASPRCGVRME